MLSATQNRLIQTGYGSCSLENMTSSNVEFITPLWDEPCPRPVLLRKKKRHFSHSHVFLKTESTSLNNEPDIETETSSIIDKGGLTQEDVLKTLVEEDFSIPLRPKSSKKVTFQVNKNEKKHPRIYDPQR